MIYVSTNAWFAHMLRTWSKWIMFPLKCFLLNLFCMQMGCYATLCWCFYLYVDCGLLYVLSSIHHTSNNKWWNCCCNPFSQSTKYPNGCSTEQSTDILTFTHVKKTAFSIYVCWNIVSVLTGSEWSERWSFVAETTIDWLLLRHFSLSKINRR